MTADLHGASDFQACDLPGGAHPDDDFILSPFKHAPVHDLQPVAHFERRGLHAAQRDIHIGAGRAFREIDDDKQLRGGQRPLW